MNMLTVNRYVHSITDYLLKVLSSLDINGVAETKFVRYIVAQGFVHFPLKQEK